MDCFFERYNNEFMLEPINGNGFRKCQLGSIWAVKSHFTKSDKPALISMPTGSGKTAVMLALSFAFKAKKILIISPSRVIRDQIANEFSNMTILKRIGAIKNDFIYKPVVDIRKTKCTTNYMWENLIAKNDVVVATPKTVSAAEKNVVSPDSNTFDLVLIDEAHHAPAVTWNALIDEFGTSKIVLFTATPFRRDKKRIRAVLVYHYSISNALKDGIYRPVNYLPVITSLDDNEKDIQIAEAAAKVYIEENTINSSVKLLIKTETIKHAEKLIPIYKSAGLNVSTIHNDKSDKENSKIIEQCKNGDIQGLICVGMIGEGLDIPDLKIAVLHAVPRTLPFTIQFIGRLTRSNSDQKGNGFLVADPNYVSGEISSLYKYDKGWYDLIPSLVDERVRSAGFLRENVTDNINPYEIDVKEIEPFFSTRIYKIKNDFVFNNDFTRALPSDLDIAFYSNENDNSPKVLISCVDEELSWGKRIPLSSNRYDLHIFYEIGNFLFEYTSSDYYCNRIKRVLFKKGTYERVDSDIIKNGLKDTSGREYFMIGLSNSAGISRSNPKYKIFLGKEVQSALRISDGRVFSVGHALARITTKETRGISLNNSRIWAIIRGNIELFADWCKWLHNLIESKPDKAGMPQMGFLADTQYVSILPSEPIAVFFDDTLFYTAKVIIEYEGTIINDPNPHIEIVTYSSDSNSIKCNLYLKEDVEAIEINYRLGESPCWLLSSEIDINIHMEFGNDEPYRNSFQGYLDDYPPLIILASGQTLNKNALFTPKIRTEQFNQDLFISQVWEDTDISSEADPPENGFQYNVQQKTIELIKPSLCDNDILVIDDRSNEVADIVVIRPLSKIVEFYHCKYKISEGNKPGANKLDITELIDQGIRTGYWIHSTHLFSRLLYRLSGKSCLVKGSIKKLTELNKRFYPFEWKYKVVLVQPAISKHEVFRKKTVSNIEKLLCTLYDRTRDANADLEIWGS